MNGQLARIYERDGYICWLCKQIVLPEDASRDHVIPRSQFRDKPIDERWVFDLDDNLKLAHRGCNSERHSPPRKPWLGGWYRIQ